MPLKPIDYSKGLIYQIEKEGIVYYVGSTTHFTNRKSSHKGNCKNVDGKKYNYPIYIFIRDNGGWDAFRMILIEYYKCNDRPELEAREQHWINENKTHLLNTNYASRTREQWCIDNREDIAIKKAKYAQDNRAELQKYKQQYHIENREEINAKNAKYRQDKLEDEDYQATQKEYKAKYYNDNKETIAIQGAEYYNDNKVELAIKNAKYREDNKEKIAIQRAKYRLEKLKDVEYQKKVKAYKAKWQQDKKKLNLAIESITV